MSDTCCHVCGHQPAPWAGPWQGRDVRLCYECWEELVGTGDEDPPDDEEWED